MKQDQIKDRARAVIERYSLPDFIIGFDVRIGEFDGDPAMWIVFNMIPGPGRLTPETSRRVRAMRALEDVLRPGLFEAFEDGPVYFHYKADRSQKTAAE